MERSSSLTKELVVNSHGSRAAGIWHHADTSQDTACYRFFLDLAFCKRPVGSCYRDSICCDSCIVRHGKAPVLRKRL
eukprot:SAG22_NODE_10164_length_549_cov_3.206667_1_plen_76_part_10